MVCGGGGVTPRYIHTFLGVLAGNIPGRIAEGMWPPRWGTQWLRDRKGWGEETNTCDLGQVLQPKPRFLHLQLGVLSPVLPLPRLREAGARC